MAHLSQVDVDTLVGAFENKVYGVGDILMTQGEEGDCFYVIEVRATRPCDSIRSRTPNRIHSQPITSLPT